MARKQREPGDLFFLQVPHALLRAVIGSGASGYYEVDVAKWRDVRPGRSPNVLLSWFEEVTLLFVRFETGEVRSLYRILLRDGPYSWLFRLQANESYSF